MPMALPGLQHYLNFIFTATEKFVARLPSSFLQFIYVLRSDESFLKAAEKALKVEPYVLYCRATYEREICGLEDCQICDARGVTAHDGPYILNIDLASM
jgi:hypothetical protein